MRLHMSQPVSEAAYMVSFFLSVSVYIAVYGQCVLVIFTVRVADVDLDPA